jgi:hypothetical protein
VLGRSSYPIGELTHREIPAPSVDLILEVPVAVDIGLEDVAAEDVLHNEGSNTALAASAVGWKLFPTCLDRPRGLKRLI